MKVYELMNLLATLPAGAKVILSGALNKKKAEEFDKGLLSVDATFNGSLIDSNEESVILGIDC